MTYRKKSDFSADDTPSAAFTLCSVIAGALLMAAISYVAAQIEGPEPT